MVRQRLNTAGILVIASTLVAHFFIQYVWPPVYLSLRKGEFYNLSVDCLAAQASEERIRDSTNLSEQHRSLLSDAASVELLSCRQLDIVKHQLLSKGVDPSTLSVINLQAESMDGTSLERTVGSYAEPNSVLRRIILGNNIGPLPTRSAEVDAKYILGRALFFDPILSGNRDVSCATCHLYEYGLSDGLPLSVGVGGQGRGARRTRPDSAIEHPRNSLDLWNRDNNSVRSLFWDGRVEMLDPRSRRFRSPLGDLLPQGLENTLAVQALFPLITPDEMLGYNGDVSANDLPREHAAKRNEFAAIQSGDIARDHRLTIYEAIVDRLVGCSSDAPANWQLEYRQVFAAAYPNKDAERLSIVDVANALAHYEEIAFATRSTPWDRYVAGDESAMDIRAKRGAILFFGKGKCVVCHNGPVFSDFEFYALGVPHAGPGIDMQGIDYGRYHATSNPNDKFKFRTPPLRNVTLTAPYFHNGSAETLYDVIRHHMDPLRNADQYGEDGRLVMSLDEIQAVSEILDIRISLSADEIEQLLTFLEALEDVPTQNVDLFVPDNVPSGLPVEDTYGGMLP